jgi:hypothetical protein
MRCRFAAHALLISSLAAAPALAVSIGTGAFTGTQSVEHFEGITVGANVAASAFGNIFLPGSTGNYTFASGITLRGPNPGLFQNGAFIHETSLGGATNAWGTNGSVSNASQVPDAWGTPSSAYLGAFDSLGAGSALIDISFTTDMRRVGAFVAGAGGSSVTIEAYDAANTLLETLTIASPSVAAWSSGFLGLERTEGIRRVVFRGADFGIDALTFEAGAAVAEPSTALLASFGALGLWWMGGRRPRAIALARAGRA